MLRTLYNQIGQYKRASLLTPVFTSLEVVMDVLIPYVTALLIDRGINAGDMGAVYMYGGVMVLMACLSLAFGIMSGRTVAYASTGFAANLRSAMYRNIQRFSFSDIDRFSTSGLITRMTVDVNNLQNAFQQILRVTVRAPFRLLFSIFMCFVIDIRLSYIFIIATLILGVALYFIITRVARLFSKVFVQYDELNASVQENVAGVRVVKAFVRQEYENTKFGRAAQKLYNLYVRAESLMALNHPVMNMVVYGCIIALSWFGAQFVVAGSLTTGELTSLFTYVMSILQSMMMLSMIFVMITQSAASGKRVAEVIDAQPDIQNPKRALTEVPDGRIDFNKVYFAYSSGSGEYALCHIHGKARRLLHHFAAGGFDYMLRLKARVLDYALRLGIRLFDDGPVASALHDPPFVESQGAEIAVAKAPPVGGQAELDLGESGNAAVFLVGGVTGAHVGQRVDVVHLLSGQGLCGRILHDKEFAVVGLVKASGLEGVSILVLDREAVCVLPLIAADLFKIGEPCGVVDALFIAGLIDGTVDVSDVAYVDPGGQRVGDLRDAVLAHAVRDEVGA